MIIKSLATYVLWIIELRNFIVYAYDLKTQIMLISNADNNRLIFPCIYRHELECNSKIWDKSRTGNEMQNQFY